ncbi:hypothetical protein DFH09DRAFT_1399894, partial [Mycena vulgaris]
LSPRCRFFPSILIFCPCVDVLPNAANLCHRIGVTGVTGVDMMRQRCRLLNRDNPSLNLPSCHTSTPLPSIATIRAANAAWRPTYTPAGVFAGATLVSARAPRKPSHVKHTATRISFSLALTMPSLTPSSRESSLPPPPPPPPEESPTPAMHAAGGGGLIDLADLGLKKGLMVEGLAERNPGQSFTHTHLGAADTPFLRNSRAGLLCIVCLPEHHPAWRVRHEIHRSPPVHRAQAPPATTSASVSAEMRPLSNGREDARRSLWDQRAEVVGGVQL